MREIGKNVRVFITSSDDDSQEHIDTEPEGQLVIIVDLGKEFGLSSTGKSTTVASSGGFKEFSAEYPGFLINLNVVKK